MLRIVLHLAQLGGDGGVGRPAGPVTLVDLINGDDSFEAGDVVVDAAMALCERVAQVPKNQLHMMKLLVNQVIEQMGLSTTQLVGTLLDGSARHSPEGTAFTQRAMEDVRAAVTERDGPFGDYGSGPRTA